MTITEKVKITLYVILSIAIVTSFFIHEFLPKKTDNYIKAKATHLSKKKERTLALNKVKEFSKNSKEYQFYIEKVELTNEAWENLLKVKQEDKVMGFTNLQQFLGEFGWAFGLFLYSFSCYIIACIERNSFRDIKLIHVPVIFISLFYIIYTIQPYSDFSKFSYAFAALILTCLLSIITFFIVTRNRNIIFNLKENIRDLVGFVLRNTKETKEDDKWKLLDKVSKR